MEKDVMIRINGISTQSEDQESADVVEFFTSGRYSRDEDSYYITYAESEITGLEGTTTTLKVDPACVTLMRSGAVRSHMVFEKDHKHFSYYETPYGSVMVGVNAFRLVNDLNEHGGNLEVDYSVDIDSSEAGVSAFRINVREQ
jgi:uncharacterized beta-barrel protein YwiB (DUF1934 family)